ncbi:MAG: hypothetical protein M1281_11660 [Chloroflexi bacterium]|nr:hypothetical protein [Chloroflexota bacterium]
MPRLTVALKRESSNASRATLLRSAIDNVSASSGNSTFCRSIRVYQT